MKSLLIGLVFMFTSFTGTTDVKKELTVDAEVCQFWLEVKVDCGNDFWLCIDDISLDEVGETAAKFEEGRC